MNHSFTAELPVLPFQLGQFYTICSTYKWDLPVSLRKKKTSNYIF